MIEGAEDVSDKPFVAKDGDESDEEEEEEDEEEAAAAGADMYAGAGRRR